MAAILAADLPGTSTGDDNRRTRELYRYVEPKSLVFRDPQDLDTLPTHFQAVATPSLSSALRPFVQLAALRCNIQRAFISVVDNDSQYFLSEASRILDVSNEETFQDDEQLLWLGCGGVSKEGKLCQGTMSLPKTGPGDYAFFIVNDLPAHPKYGKLPFVTGEPFFRFYAGTPLTTKNGIRIGSFCVMDTKPRDDLSLDERNFLGGLAEQTMTYLEINRDALDGRRSRLMSNALHRFVQGKSTIVPTPAPSARVSMIKSTAEPFEEETAVASPIGRDSSSNIGTTTSGDATDHYGKGAQLHDEADDSRSHTWTLARAANLLREALEVDDAGGILFLEASSRYILSPARRSEAAPTETDTSGAEESFLSKPGVPQSMGRSFGERRPSSASKSVSFSASNVMTSRGKPSPVQASSTAAAPIAPADHSVNKAKFNHVEAEFLGQLLQRYPRGKLWVFDADGSLMSSDDDQTSSRRSIDLPSNKQPQRGRKKKMEAEHLQRLFPGSRQLIFVPLWDASLGRWFSGCFSWSGSDHRTYSTSELAFTASFVKSVMAEVNRLNTLMSDKQKGDFISSVSHELRSPLHGILASAEFLGEGGNNLNIQQRNLVETIEACGRTLLDTINHVLDFSKINTFEQSWKKDRRSSTFDPVTIPTPTRQLPNAAPPLLRLYAHTDIAAIAEEVVEGLCVGRLFGKTTDLTDVSVSNIRPGSLQDKKPTRPKDSEELVDVLLDIEQGDWQFVTQPGALRRVIMNLVGNSLKYTARGSVKVRLRQESVEDDEAATKEETKKNIILTVADTGKGISPEYLQSKLFVPFAQEDTLTPGTGLGLSIVRSIITMLAGTIDVQSTVGKGTTMTVVLPVLRPSAVSASDSSNPPSDSTVSSQADHIYPLREIGRDKSIGIYAAPGPSGTFSEQKEWASVVSRYITQWFGLSLVEETQSNDCDLLVIEEQDLAQFSQSLTSLTEKRRHGLIVLCNNSNQQPEAGKKLNDPNRIIEYVTKPCGPYKLARAFRSCLERINDPAMNQPGATSESSSTPTEQVPTDLLEQMQEMELDSNDKNGKPMVVQTNETITVKETSRNGQMALSSPFYEGPDGSPSPAHEFPFPETASPRPQPRRTSSKQKGASQKQTPTSPTLGAKMETHRRQSSITSRTAENLDQQPFDPHVLLVEDNAINLRLLQTFMQKRKYSSVDSAENGALAVQAVQNAKKPYDIIFMDVSMPVMNGFEATRAIREFEESQHHQNLPHLLSPTSSSSGSRPKPAMIIALTGLASGRDQSEGFASGIDIYMTKPVSFKEVSKFLDNWEINRRSTSSAVQSAGDSPPGGRSGR